MVVASFWGLKTVNANGEFFAQFIQVINPMSTQGGCIADKLPPKSTLKT